jgi:epoxide hydrolase-like predicted phosphatase
MPGTCTPAIHGRDPCAHERMRALTIRAVVFDIGGVLELSPDGREPTIAFGELIATWEKRLNLTFGELNQRISDMKLDGALGSSLEEWQDELRAVTGMNQAQADAFMRDFWDVYLGTLNTRLAAYFRGLRPRYQTALLSNSFVGAREQEQERYHFAEMTDLLIYSHEEGIAKPDRRIYELTCERLGVQPDEMIFLDDAEKCSTAARELGIHAILFRDTEQAIADIDSCLRAHAS